MMKPIIDIAGSLGIEADDLELYGKYKAKLSSSIWDRVQNKADGKLILVTAMNPTPAGEGKTLTTIGLSQALNLIGKQTIAALREPSLGPCMGMKGGATGSGKAQIVPADDINLHFTGDLHAISSTHNLLAAMLDNHLFHGNALQINPQRVLWKRAVDMNDRALRNIVVGLQQGAVREDGYMITVASEIMAILCLSESLDDLRTRLGNIIVAYNYAGNPVRARELEADGAMTVLLKDAFKPNLVQTIENTPVIVHGGPFANIAHGCSSVIGTKLGLKLADYVVTEAGFGADLGAEKFFHIKCRKAGLKPSAAVLVVTVKALKYNGGVSKNELGYENLRAIQAGFVNVEKHIENLRSFGVPVIVAINHFATDTDAEIQYLQSLFSQIGVQSVVSQVWERGGEGGVELARQLVDLIDREPSQFHFLYNEQDPIISKIETLVKQIYGGAGIQMSMKAKKAIQQIEALGADQLPLCIAKTPYSFSDNPKLLGRPQGFTMNIKDVQLSAGAEFIVVLTGDIMTMPGLPKVPQAIKLDIDDQGNIMNLS